MDSTTLTVLAHPYQVLLAAVVLARATRAVLSALRDLVSDDRAKLPVETPAHSA
jgi:hypothetical protein